jgi:2-C-methyl-D-erythritol 4-phosphate cytidylyltransferase
MIENRIGISCLIAAAGSGERLGLGSKGLLELNGRPLLCWLADKLQAIADEVLVAVQATQVHDVAAMLPDCRVIAGGRTRQQSLDLLADQARGDLLLEHDGARPFASIELFRAVLAAARRHGCAAAVLDPEVVVAQLRDGMLHAAYGREEMGLTQTPQAYSRGLMSRVRERTRANGWNAEATVVQRALLAGEQVGAVRGEKTNIKITTIEDWTFARGFEVLLG